MPKIEKPQSKFLNVADWKKAIKTAKKESDKVCVILEPPHISSTNPQMLVCMINNAIIGDKEIYDYVNKFQDFFDAYGDNTDEWTGKMLIPVCPEKESIFFVRFECQAGLTEDIAK